MDLARRKKSFSGYRSEYFFFARHFNSVVQETKICYYDFSMHPQICGVKSGGVTYGKPGIFK
jgi:hypothetical protein